MKLDRTNLILDVNFLSGSTYDTSGINGTGTIHNGEGFVKTHDGWGFHDLEGEFTGYSRNTYVSYPHDSSQDLDACSMTVRIDGVTDADMGAMLGKQDAYQFVLGYPGYFSGSLVLQGSGPSYSYISLSLIPEGTKTLGVTKASGSSAPKFYADGAYIGTGGSSISLGTSSNNLVLTNMGQASPILSPTKPIQCILLRNAENTPEQMAADHKELVNRKTVFEGKRNFYTPPSIPALKTGAGWNFKHISGQILDQGQGLNNGSFTGVGAVIQTETVWGEPALKFGSDTGRYDCGASSNIDYTTETFGGWIWIKPESFGSNTVAVFRGNVNNSGWYINVDPGGTFRFFVNQSGANQQAQSSSTLQVGRWNLIGWLSVAGDKNYVYMDAEQSGTTPTRIDPVAASSTYNFTIGAGNGGSAGFPGELAVLRVDEFSSQEDFESQLKKEWNRVANKIIYHEDFSDAHVLQSAVSGIGYAIPGTNWEVLTVSGQVVDGPDNGTKSITSPSAGNSLKTAGIEHTFGRIEIDCTPTSGTRCRHAFAEPGAFSILDVGDSGNGRIAYTTSTGGIVFATSNGSSTTNRQTIRIDKKANQTTNNTSIYRDNILLTASTGSNPCTDITNFTLDRQITTYSNAQIHSIKHYFGVPIDN